ncbi:MULTISPECIES: tRNA (adenosine(37)-N6)-dimethylallyltransferase MiaA [unclassified Collinsella]|uniref:tRNA (adenosine(37)-N6)-dimethylallyltransferase MiaA n=1 Tax=unclassified Collinsella TaxID=2637548 RepID=UPI0011C7963E|nr:MULTISPECIES: tRNA (adenosine(37)-N6)-dimethylallyltransferase MiaA [unclassified Collinsella]TXF36644.1 tRNA (adenosine(37)-N6)-dimethylallyltransferase MiaA [Collinsella sp. BA40]
MLPVLSISGPTASGKSALADEVALRLNTDVISVDAMQVYRGMDIGTAKTPVADRRVPLQMIDVADPDEPYSVALFQRDARKLIDDRLASGHIPILCGGTGLYIQAVLEEMRFPQGEVDDERRTRYNALAEQLGADGLYSLLEQRDPRSAAAIHPNNVRRVVRALEMADEGVSYADQRAGFAHPSEHYPSLRFALTMDRSRLYRRIDARVDLMIEAGLVDEVSRLLDQGMGDALTSRQAIGYKEVIDALEGRLTIDEAVELIKLRSRRYAKRQLSWCRRDPKIQWIDMDALSIEQAAGFIIEQLERFGG